LFKNRSIHYGLLSAIFNPLHSSTSQELVENHLCNQCSQYENNGRCHSPQLYLLLSESEASIVNYCILNLLHSQRSTSVIKVATLKNANDFRYTKKPLHATSKVTLFTVSKDEWRTLVSLWKMHCTYCGMPKGTSWAEAMLNSENIKSVALAIIKLWRHQSGSQSVENSTKNVLLKFRSNFLKAFRVDLKAFLDLVLPNQYCPIIIWESWGWFLSSIISWAIPTPW